MMYTGFNKSRTYSGKKIFTWAIQGWLLISLACSMPGILPDQTTSGQGTAQNTAESTSPSDVSAPFAAALLEVWPAKGSVINRKPEFIFTFNQPMLHQSVEDSISFQPPIETAATWIDDSTVKYSADSTLESATDLEVTIGADAMSASGQKMKSPVAITYLAPPVLAVSRQVPAADALDVEPATSIRVEFNQPALSLLSKTYQDESPAFSLTPEVAGKGEWISPSTYQFYPDKPLAGQTSYQVSLRQELVGKNQPTGWKFTTTKLQVVSMTPEIKGSVLGLSDPLRVRFNQPLDRQSIEQNVSLQVKNDAQPVKVSFAWDEDGCGFSLTPDNSLTRDTKYTLVLPDSVKGTNGDPLAGGQDYEFKTVSDFSLITTDPLEIQKINYENGYNQIGFKFNNPVEDQDFSNLISIEPAVDDLSFEINHDENSIILNGLFKPETVYWVDLSSGLKDRWGGTLVNPRHLKFTTSASRPRLDIPILEYSKILVLRPQDIQINAWITNLKTLSVKSSPLRMNDLLVLDQDRQLINNLLVDFSEEFTQVFPDSRQGIQGTVKIKKDNQPFNTGIYYFYLNSDEMSKDFPDGFHFIGVVSHQNLTVKRSQSEVFVWGVDLDSGLPSVQQTVRLLDKDGQLVGTCTTDMDGVCRVSLPEAMTNLNDNRFWVVMGNPGDDGFALGTDQWNAGISGVDFGYQNRIEDSNPVVYLTSGQSVYQPGQSVNFWAVVRDRKNGGYLMPGYGQLNLKVSNSQVDGTKPLQAPVMIPLALSSYGTASGVWQVPEDAAPGTYRFEFAENVEMQPFEIRVVEKQPSQIIVQVESSQKDIQTDSNISAKVTTEDEWGNPVGNVSVHWTLKNTPGVFNLGDGYQAGLLTDNPEDYQPQITSGNPATQGSGITDESGNLVLDIKPEDVPGLVRSGYNGLVLQVTAVLENGLSSGGYATYNLHPAWYIGLQAEPQDSLTGMEMGWKIQTTDWVKKPLPNRVLKAELHRITWRQPTYLLKSDHHEYPQAEYNLVSSVDLTTDQNGQARITFLPQESGDYLLMVSGDGAVSSREIRVGGAGVAPNTWANLPNQHLAIRLDSTVYRVGQSIHYSFPNPLGEKAMALITLERGNVIESQVVQINGASYNGSFEIQEGWAPNVYLAVTLIGQTAEGHAGFRQGYQSISVEPVRETLNVGLSIQPADAGPGDRVLMAVRVKDKDGQPVTGRFSLLLAEKQESVLSSQSNRGITQILFGYHPLGVLTGLGLAGDVDRLLRISDEGQTINQDAMENTSPASWFGEVETDTKGMAQLELLLPDKLAAWVVSLQGIDQQSRVGEASVEIGENKPLMIRPLIPDFVSVGDHVQIGSVVYNRTENPLAVEAAIAVEGLTLDDAQNGVRKITVGPMSKVEVFWPATVMDVESANVIYNAVSGLLSDQTRADLTVSKYFTNNMEAASGLMDQAGEDNLSIQIPAEANPNNSELHLSLYPSLSAFLVARVNQRDILSKEDNKTLTATLLEDTAIDEAFEDNQEELSDLITRVREDIDEKGRLLTLNQNADGGWGWRTGMDSEKFISACVLISLAKMTTTGYGVDPLTIDNAQTYLRNGLSTLREKPSPAERNLSMLIQYALTVSSSGSDEVGISLADWQESAEGYEQLSPWAEALLALGLEKVQSLDPRPQDVLAHLAARGIHESDGVFWEDSVDTENPVSTIGNTALTAYALSQWAGNEELSRDALYFLMRHQIPAGAWGNGLDKAWVSMVISDRVKQDLDIRPKFSFAVKLNNQLLVVKQSESKDMFSPVEQTIGLAKLQKGSPNQLTITREAGEGMLFYHISPQTSINVSKIKPVNKGLTLTRRYELSGEDCWGKPCEAVSKVNLSEIKAPLTVRLSLVVPEDMNYLVVEDTIPGGTFMIKTRQVEDIESSAGGVFMSPQISQNGITWLAGYCPAGTYELTYKIMPQTPGLFQSFPARAYSGYFPEIESFTSGGLLEITKE